MIIAIFLEWVNQSDTIIFQATEAWSIDKIIEDDVRL